MNGQRRFGLITAAVGSVMALGALVSGGSASATKEEPLHKVTLCHANSNEKDPYVMITVDISSVDEFNRNFEAGHGGHGNDGVWYPGAKDADPPFNWGDIIPPFTFEVEGEDDEMVTVEYKGLNWTDAGQAIFENDCNVPGETTVPETTVPETTIPETTIPATTPKSAETTTSVAQEAPTTAVAGEEGNLPGTGSTQTLLLGLGLAMALGGGTMSVLARRPSNR